MASLYTPPKHDSNNTKPDYRDLSISIKPSNENVKKLYKNHKQRKGDSGLDVFFPDDIEVPPKCLGFMIDLKIACQAEYHTINGCEYERKPTSFLLIPRSSISKTPLRLSNSIGLIDQIYLGTLKAVVDNFSEEPFKITRGQRLFQIIAPDLEKITFQFVEEFKPTERGTGGFGSTGL